MKTGPRLAVVGTMAEVRGQDLKSSADNPSGAALGLIVTLAAIDEDKHPRLHQNPAELARASIKKIIQNFRDFIEFFYGLAEHIPMVFDIRRLTFFVNICDKRSLTAAASLSRVTQPVLSYHLAELERTLGEPLLHRRPDGVEPTEAGRALLAHARPILAAVRAAETAMRERREQPGGTVSVGLLASIAPSVAPRLVSECKARFPLIQLRIAEGTSLHLRSGIISNQFDLAVNLRDRGENTSRSLLFEDLYLVARRGLIDLRKETVSLHYALQYKLLLPPKGHVVRALLEDAAQKHALTIQTEAEVEGLATLKALVAEAIGPAILGYGAIKTEYESGIYVAAKIVRPVVQRELVLDEAAERRYPKAVEEIKAILIDVIQGLAR